MKRQARVLTRAQRDVTSCYDFPAERSRQGAASWFHRFVETRDRLAEEADRCALAYESPFVVRELREVLFKTRKGRPYRIVVAIDEDEVLVLRVRGPGQDALTADQLE
jgi:plasmid stabilization system protein ParE